MNNDETIESYDSESRSQELQDELETNQVPHDGLTIYTLDNVRMGKKLGKGAFGTILAGHVTRRRRNDPQLIAVKCISKRKVAKRRLLKQLGLEISAHRSLHHPNILQFYDFTQDNDNVYFFLEYAEFGDLLNYVTKFNPDEAELSSILYQVGKAIEYCHSVGIVHRDNKPENVLITGDRVPKLTDFGYCDKINERGYCTNELFCGTTSYMSPEMINESPCSYATDVWSFGVMIFDLIVGFPPFDSRERRDTYRKIRGIQVPWDDRTVLRTTKNCENVIRSIFVMPPESRPTMTEVLQDDWFFMFQ